MADELSVPSFEGELPKPPSVPPRPFPGLVEGVFVPLDTSDKFGKRDWEVFVTAMEKGCDQAAHIHGISRCTVWRIRKRVAFALQRAVYPVHRKF